MAMEDVKSNKVLVYWVVFDRTKEMEKGSGKRRRFCFFLFS